MKSDIEIAQEAKMKPIIKIAESIGLNEDDKTREYLFTEMFTRNKDGETFKRYSSYRSVNGIESYLEKKYAMDPKYLEEFIASKTKGMSL